MTMRAQSFRRSIPESLLRGQLEASDPAASAWVAANAGSGKTHVLAQRVIRLLLGGVDPARVLCITFTRAAAANMANRVFEELRRWTLLDDGALADAIRRAADIDGDALTRARARRLFALALETPGGLKVQTIHAFCTRLLHQFPFEADVAARFSVLDEEAEARLLGETTLAVLLEAALAPHSALGRALAIATPLAADRTLKEVIAEAIRRRHVVRAWIERGGSVEGAIAVLCGTLAIGADDTIERIETEMTQGPLLPVARWTAVAQALVEGSSNDQKQACRLLAALNGSSVERAALYLQVFFTDRLEPRNQIVTKAIADAQLAGDLDAEQGRLCGLLERRKAVACRDRTQALITIADAVLSRYRAAKDRRSLIDYDDLIDKTVALLRNEGAAWVHYKLDQGIDHVLIDEAQDTSPRQWEIVRLLTGEFFSGAGARTPDRTIFAVGDEKQSIFSFQGAAPKEFAVMRDAFRQSCKAAEKGFNAVRLRHSFRSGANVLAAVDRVFAQPAAYSGLSADTAGPVHEPLPDAPPGQVEIWETMKPGQKREIEAWDAPFDELTEKSPQLRLASRIAAKIKQWIGQGARAGDVLVLVRQRGALFEAIIRALKDARIEVAGADRLVLTEHIAVMDLMALADALLLPEDDLALASVLKSPLFGLDDDDLFAIAWQRSSSLRAALREKASSAPRFKEAAQALDRYAERAVRDSPFGFFAHVLGADGGRRRFLARLGYEANDALEEFLNLALDYERRETPSLQGFMAWLRTAQTEVKRDMEITRDEVRVMTVHAAKGLEASIVVLADTTTEPAGPPQRRPRLIELGEEGGLRHFAWAGAMMHDAAAVAAARQRMRGELEAEHRRLLYVAMTRAIGRLIVCGAEGERKPADGCWWKLVFAGLKPELVEAPTEDGECKVWRFQPFAQSAEAQVPVVPTAAAVAERPPRWLACPVVQQARAARLALAPSHAYAAEGVGPRAAGSEAERRKAMARGVLIHRLLQSLPDIAPAARIRAVERYLDRAAGLFDQAERDNMRLEVQRLLDDPRFAELFLPGSHAEVSIAGRVMVNGSSMTVRGQVDRLAVTARSVLIADYKTDRDPPRGAVPMPYVTQLALYRGALGELYPERSIRAALIFTQTPELVEIPPPMLDAALGVTSA